MSKVELMQKLKDAREIKNVSLQDASRVLSIRAQVLQDLEEGNYHKLGALLYVKSYTRKYAAYLKLDASEIEYLLSNLEDPFQEEKQESPIRAQLNEEKRMVHRSFFRWYLLIISALLAAGVVTYFVYGEKIADIFPVKPTPERVINDYQQEVTNLSTSIPVVNTTDEVQLINGTSNIEEPINVIDTKATLSEFALDQILSSSNGIVLESHQSLPDTDTIAPLPEGIASLSITLGSDESWLQIKDKDQKVLMNEVLPANATYHIDGAAPFSLHLGNAKSIDKMMFNGKEVESTIYRPTSRTTVSKFILKLEKEN